MRTIKTKLIIAFVIILVSILTGTFFVFMTIRDQYDGKNVINLAGRQRMLTQKYFKEVNNELLTMQLRHSTLKAAEIATLQIVEDRKQYTKNIIGKLRKDGIVNVHPNKNYAEIIGGIPLPATFVQEVSNTISQTGIYSYDLLSKWNINKDKGLNTDFEKKAFDHLYSKKGKVFYDFMKHNGLYTLRYATADIAVAEACVSCHNNHEKSPKKDFKLGDVMGILVVKIPIGTVSASTEYFFVDIEDRQQGEYASLKTKEIFDMTLAALKKGGKAPLDLEMVKFTELPASVDPKITGKLNEVEQLWNTMQADLEKLLKLEPNSAEYAFTYDAAYSNANATLTAMNEAVDMYQSNSVVMMNVLLWIQAGSVGIICVIIALTWLILIQPHIKTINKVAGMVKNISEGEGDLTMRVKVESRDEIGELANQFNAFIEKIHAIISMVKSTTVEVNSSSRQISAAIEEQAAITSQQSSAVTEITSTMEELSTTSTQIADNAESVVQISNEALDSSKKGTEAIEEINEKMNAISQDNQHNIEQIVELGRKSKEITTVMEIINNIADQTKLIAFNAAIEASSAGEAGKRFGVVAVEIRRLADNVMESTDEIHSKIEDIQEAVNRLVITSEKGSKRVEEGMELAAQTVDVLNNILAGAQSTTDSSKQISFSSQQQKSASKQVVTSLKEITEGSRQISASIKQTSTTTSNLTRLSNDLKGLIERFKLNGKLGEN